jgi:hypothetical protein
MPPKPGTTRRLAAQHRRAQLERAVRRSIRLERAGRYLEAEAAVEAFGRSDLVERWHLYDLRHRLRAAS